MLTPHSAGKYIPGRQFAASVKAPSRWTSHTWDCISVGCPGVQDDLQGEHSGVVLNSIYLPWWHLKCGPSTTSPGAGRNHEYYPIALKFLEFDDWFLNNRSEIASPSPSPLFGLPLLPPGSGHRALRWLWFMLFWESYFIYRKDWDDEMVDRKDAYPAFCL